MTVAPSCRVEPSTRIKQTTESARALRASGHGRCRHRRFDFQTGKLLARDFLEECGVARRGIRSRGPEIDGRFVSGDNRSTSGEHGPG
jgi:hypothetical protein